MSSPLISPLLWQSVPYQDDDAWLNFLGEHQTWHDMLGKRTFTRTFNLDDLRTNLLGHQGIHEALWHALGLASVDDLDGYDLSNRESYNNFMYIHSLDHQRIRLVARV